MVHLRGEIEVMRIMIIAHLLYLANGPNLVK
jgi:hypothetical protein